MSAVAEAVRGMEYVRARMARWGEFQRAAPGAGSRGFPAVTAFMLGQQPGGCGECAEVPPDVEEVESALCRLKRMDTQVYVALVAGYLLPDLSDEMLAARTRMSRTMLKERRSRGEMFMVAALTLAG